MIARRAVPILALTVAACGGGGSPPSETASFPDAPASLQRPPEYRWDDAIAARDNRMAAHVADALGPRFGKAREDHFVASAGATATLRQDYTRRLGQGWTPLPLSWSAGENGFAFAAGKRALVVAWLDPQRDGRVPVTVFRFGDR